jgi:GT2 family glycosyltransferase
LGYAPANNVGLRLARGEFVVFLNSDVFPGTADWLERLAATLAGEPRLGAIAPLLLFENGSVQHQGLSFRQLPEFGDWWFCDHPNKGRKFTGTAQLMEWPAVTGACMMMRRTLAEELGGFDEAYAIGDFEDADLCLRMQELGLGCAVDPTVALYHLERRSQASSALRWRMNLTLFNAWLFQNRGGKRVAQRMAEGAAAEVGA